MKFFSGRYLFYFLVLIFIEILVIVAVVINASIDTSGWASIAPVFEFLSQWVILISVIIVCLGVLFFFIGSRQSYRGRFLSKLHDWASDAVIVLSRYRQEKAGQDARSGNFKALVDMINSLMLDSNSFLVDGFLETGMRSRKKEVIRLLNSIRKKALRKDKSAFDELPRLQHDLADMMLLTFESTSGETSAPEK